MVVGPNSSIWECQIGPTIELPRTGNYRIEIVNEDYDGVLDNCSRTGGIIELMRNVKLEQGYYTDYYMLWCMY